MEAKELMIGDWYRNIEYDECKQWTIFNYDDTNTDYVESVPLTEDILKANGWHKDTSKYWNGENVWCYGIGQDKEVRVHFGEDGYYLFAYITIWYQILLRNVHELQHALRLCGLTELADNFKVV